MGNTSFIVLRTARHDGLELTGPGTQFAELTGAYWLEPIYAGLAKEWNRQGRTVPGAPREHWRVLPDGSRGLDGPDTHSETHAPDVPEQRDGHGPQDTHRHPEPHVVQGPFGGGRTEGGAAGPLAGGTPGGFTAGAPE